MIMSPEEEKAINLLREYYRSTSNLSLLFSEDEFIWKVMRDAWNDTISEIENNAKQGKKQNIDNVKKVFMKKIEEHKVLEDPANFK